jgi:hypothetical protein
MNIFFAIQLTLLSFMFINWKQESCSYVVNMKTAGSSESFVNICHIREDFELYR